MAENTKIIVFTDAMAHSVCKRIVQIDRAITRAATEECPAQEYSSAALRSRPSVRIERMVDLHDGASLPGRRAFLFECGAM